MKDRYDSDIYVNDAESYWKRMQQWFKHYGINEHDINEYMNILVADPKTPKWELRHIAKCYLQFHKNAEEHLEDRCYKVKDYSTKYGVLKDEYNVLAEKHNYLVSLINISPSNNKVKMK
jgi:hypothetical protein